MTTLDSAMVARVYELAGRKLLYGRVPKDAVLVHGTAQGGGLITVPYAWVEADGSAFDALLDEWFHPAEVFYGFFKATACSRFTRQQAAQQLEATRHWGPWSCRQTEEMEAQK